MSGDKFGADFRDDLRAYAAVLRQVVSLELRRAFAYRVSFWLRFLGGLFANITVAYFLWRALFAESGAKIMAGFTFEGMILYYVLVPLIGGITRNSTEGSAIASEIYSGTLTRYLVYPMPFLLYRFADVMAAVIVALLQLTIMLSAYLLIFGIPAGIQLTPSSVALGLIAALGACFLNFLMVSTVEMVAFWADNVWSLNVMLMFSGQLLGGALLPLTLFPAEVQRYLQLTPFPYLMSFPVQAVMGKLSFGQWAQSCGRMGIWILILTVLARVVWRRGQRSFSGVGI